MPTSLLVMEIRVEPFLVKTLSLAISEIEIFHVASARDQHADFQVLALSLLMQ